MMDSTDDYGITLEWAENDQVALIAINRAVSREVYTCWRAVVTETIRHWDGEKPVMLLLDFSFPGQHMTPYAYQVLDEAYGAIPKDKQVFIVFVIGSGSGSLLIPRLIDGRAGRNPNIKEQIFSCRTAGLKWLRSRMELAIPVE